MNKIIGMLILFLMSAKVFAHIDEPWVEKKDRKTVTVAFLYEACSSIGETRGGMIPWFDCESYVYGVLDSYISIRDTIPKKQRACFPVNLAPWEALNLSLKHEYSKWNRVASTVLIENLREQYPCN
ncbi:hypothetical protein EWJ91_23140 [Salmonella enterica subsp. enterica serovar Ouagadougou]|uniref:Rap1a immunity protein domain-containing protein n=1 Tax=Salmonella enterica subsp. enterica serovar Ouagadougou TaxID=2564899 RepID=A0A5I0D6L5_SALET|nr:hypothetical protein [Salmonella enterica subsp. enterica serovar Ouagadougou]EEA4939959.1 hypothetical protein [Salmonella enterica subsp. enterica serovar Enteritidis]EBR9514349.1 hypothetical protein [Salmonella enterica subsp. enterica serovar Ouagadougou]EBV0637953.1 hypothetical protein [Salmonella enterica subsp. enterica serovar Ouagadougou]EBV0756618.1 hypothetical protein [Salmonella enterica subsp. enterica serovar Ouagadougou]